MAEPKTITPRTKPHIERGGYHTDRFDAYVEGEHIVLSRQPAYDGARKLDRARPRSRHAGRGRWP